MLARTTAPTSFGDDPNISLVTFPASAIASSSYVVPETYNCAHVTRRPGPSPRRASSTHSRSASRSVVFVDSAVANAKAFSLALVVDGDDDALDVAFARGGRARDGAGTRSSSPSLVARDHARGRDATRDERRKRCRRRGRGARRARERETGETTHPESTRSVVWKSPTRRPSRVDSRRRRGRARGRGRETSARAIVRSRETGDEGEEEARRRTRGIVRGTSGKIDRRRTDEGTSDGR